jgi:hypothetical protein
MFGACWDGLGAAWHGKGASAQADGGFGRRFLLSLPF